MAVNFQGSYLDVIGATNALDRYYDRSSQVDLSMTQKVMRNLRPYADIVNMNDALFGTTRACPSAGRRKSTIDGGRPSAKGGVLDVRKHRAVACIVALAVALGSWGGLRAQGSDRRPKLIVLLMVDQMRGDYIDRFQRQWTGGLHRLLTNGAWFRQAHYPYRIP